jgi:hypothetical protein
MVLPVPYIALFCFVKSIAGIFWKNNGKNFRKPVGFSRKRCIIETPDSGARTGNAREPGKIDEKD